MIQCGVNVKDANVVMLGLTFKENCPDLRNSRVADLVRELEEYGCKVAVHDPIADAAEARHEYGIDLIPWDKLPKADAMVAAVSHREYLDMPLARLLEMLSAGGVFVDVKSAYTPENIIEAGYKVWRL
jgi:UDP-N-acetyl-D-galactosamine dehydrogenase